MKSIWKYLILLGVFYSRCSLNFIHQMALGNLTISWKFNFTVLSSDLKGIVLYCFDSERNQFGMTIMEESSDEKFIRIIYNKKFITATLKSTCGCDPCKNIVLNFQAKLLNGIIHITCISTIMGEIKSFPITDENHQPLVKGIDHIMYTLPKSLVNSSDKMYITMGNIGPYMGEGDISVSPSRDQMVACLDKFYLNNKEILFNKNGSKMEPSCPKICEDNICNGGQCRKSMENNVVCDCNSVAFNGPYCNRSLDPYVKGGPNSFRKVKGAPYVYFKMTWKTVIPKVYCLMEIKSKYKNITIFINKTILNMDLNNVSDIDLGNINFINVNITNNYLTIKRKDKEYKYNGSLDMETRINVGFCERYKNYDIFEGEYDFSYISSQLVYEKSAPINTTIKSLVSKQIISWDIRILIIISGSILASLIIIMVLFVLLLKTRKKLENKIQRDEGRSAIQLNDTHPTQFLDTPSNETDYIHMQNTKQEDTDGYSVIDYTNMYNTTPGTSDGYLEPSTRISKEYAPPLPPRNEE